MLGESVKLREILELTTNYAETCYYAPAFVAGEKVTIEEHDTDLGGRFVWEDKEGKKVAKMRKRTNVKGQAFGIVVIVLMKDDEEARLLAEQLSRTSKINANGEKVLMHPHNASSTKRMVLIIVEEIHKQEYLSLTKAALVDAARAKSSSLPDPVALSVEGRLTGHTTYYMADLLKDIREGISKSRHSYQFQPPLPLIQAE